MRNQIIILIFITLSLSSCSVYQIESKDISTEFYASKKSDFNVVYIEDIKRPHKVIAYINVSTERRQTLGDVIEKMKIEAAILGADAITGIKSDATGRWKRLPAQDIIGNGYVRANFTVSAIIFR